MELPLDTQINTIRAWLGSGSINIFGLPYAGKDTHGRLLAAEFGAQLLGGGDILRNSLIPERAKALMDAGSLIPTDDYINIVLPYLSKQEFAGKPLILSSVGRWHGEEQGVIGACKDAGHTLKAVIYLHLDAAISRERFIKAKELGDRGTRTDDADDVFMHRLQEFKQKTLPVIEFYREAGLLIEVDGRPPVDDVTTTIYHELVNRASTSQ